MTVNQQSRYPLMSDPYILAMNYKDGTANVFIDPELMSFDEALNRAHDAFKVRKNSGIEPQLETISIQCHDRTAVIVFENEKHLWPDLVMGTG